MMGNVVECAEGIVTVLYLCPSSGSARLFLFAMANLTDSKSTWDNVRAYHSGRDKNHLL